MQPTSVTQARHQFFDWKLETRRGYPIRTNCSLKEAINLRGSFLRLHHLVLVNQEKLG